MQGMLLLRGYMAGAHPHNLAGKGHPRKATHSDVGRTGKDRNKGTTACLSCFKLLWAVVEVAYSSGLQPFEAAPIN
eukprot:10345696-Alexandrium_andersonii.AAC.1